MSEAGVTLGSRRVVLPSDGTVLRWAFYLLLAACVVLVGIDVRELARQDEIMRRIERTPVLPPRIRTETGVPAEEQVSPYAPEVETDRQQLRQNLEVSLEAGNVLRLTGAIDPGSATRFAEEAARIAAYVKIVVLNSPGGSVQDALDISHTIRERGWQTRVEKGALCASSCPIVFSGGTVRSAEDGAAIGVHQIFSPGNDPRSLDQVISGTQSSTAVIVRHLETMGVDAALWTHALETPPQNLYYLKPEELEKYRLVTDGSEAS